MSWVLDGAVLAVTALFLILGVRRGFIKSAIRLIGLIVALCAAALLSTPLSTWVFDSWLASPLHEAVAGQTAAAAVTAAQTLSEQVSAVLATMPSFVQHAIAFSGAAAPQNGAPIDTAQLTQLIMEHIVRPLCCSILQALMFLLLFLVVFLLAQWIGKGVNKVFTTLPLIRHINGFLGGALGALEGVAVVYLLTLVLRLYMTMSGASSVVSTADIEASYLLQPIMEFRLFGS